jgi:hypothetical protein
LSYDDKIFVQNITSDADHPFYHKMTSLQLRHHNLAMESQLNDANRNNNELKEQVKSLLDQLAIYKGGSYDELNRKFLELTDENISLKSQLDKLQSNYHELERVNNNLRESNDTLSNEKFSLIRNLQTKEDELSDVKSQISIDKLEYKKLERESANEVTRLQDIIKSEKYEKNKLEQNVKILNQQVKDEIALRVKEPTVIHHTSVVFNDISIFELSINMYNRPQRQDSIIEYLERSLGSLFDKNTQHVYKRVIDTFLSNSGGITDRNALSWELYKFVQLIKEKYHFCIESATYFCISWEEIFMYLYYKEDNISIHNERKNEFVKAVADLKSELDKRGNVIDLYIPISSENEDYSLLETAENTINEMTKNNEETKNYISSAKINADHGYAVGYLAGYEKDTSLMARGINYWKGEEKVRGKSIFRTM